MKCEMRDRGHKSDETLHSATGGQSENKREKEKRRRKIRKIRIQKKKATNGP